MGETLSVSTSAITDEDGLDNAVFTYRWLTDETDIAGATGPSYLLTDDDVGTLITVQVSFTNDAGNDESLASEAAAAVERPPLTAQFLDAPSSHDGQAAFTFELRLSFENFKLSYVTLRDHAFTVTNGEVPGVRRLDRDSSTPNIRWEITVSPTGVGDVTIVLPVTENCDDQGAICTEDGRGLSTRLELTVTGPER